MIVTCEKCNTSFDLENDLIQESGSEVKCSECEHVFTVYKPAPVEEPEPSPEVEGGAADFPQAEEPAEEELDMEALGLEEEPEAERPAAIEEGAATEETPRPVEEAAKEPETVSEETPPEEEVLDFDFLQAEEEPAEEELDIEALGLEEEPEAEGPAKIEEVAAMEEAPEAEAEVPEEPAKVSGEAPEEVLDFDVSEAEEKPAEIEPAAEEPGLIEEEAAAEETPEPAEEAAAEELDLEAISRAVEEAAEEPETVTEEAPEEEVLDFDLLEAEEEPIEEKPAEKEIDFEGLAVEEEPVAEEPGLIEEEAAVEEAEAKEEPEEELVEEEFIPPPVLEKAPPARKRISTPFMIVLVLGLLAGGALGAYVLLKDRIPFLQSLTGAPKPATIDPGNLHIAILDEQAKFVENSKAGRVFVIKGMVRNDYPEARSFIRVKGILYLQDGKAVQWKTSYCGNVLSDSGLQTLDKGTMDMKFLNRMGDQGTNFNIPSGKMVPFMVIFSDLPQGLGEYSVQVVSSAQVQ